MSNSQSRRSNMCFLLRGQISQLKLTRVMALSISLHVLVCVRTEPKIVDMTHAFDNNSVFWPGGPPFEFQIILRGPTDSGWWYESNKFSEAEHGGTHLDSPSHFSKGKWRVHEIQLEHLIGPGAVIDVSARAAKNPDTQLETADILAWEEDHGKLPHKAIVLMNSGWSGKWPNKELVFGTDQPDNSSHFHFPGFSPDAARWLQENRNYINAIGVDTPSMDYGQSKDFLTHRTIAGSNIVGLENVANLESIPVAGATVYAIPMKIRDGSGAPLRIFAMFDDNVNCSCCTSSGLLLLIATLIVNYICLRDNM